MPFLIVSAVQIALLFLFGRMLFGMEWGATPAYRGGLSFANTEDLMQLTGSEDLACSLKELGRRFDTDWILTFKEYVLIYQIQT